MPLFRISRSTRSRRMAVFHLMAAVAILTLPASIGRAQQGAPPATSQLTSPQPNLAQSALSQLAPPTGPAASGPNYDCGHVIDLLIANRFRQNTMQNGAELAPGLQLSSPLAAPVGDLELLAVCFDGTSDPRNGPIFEVTLRNNSNNVVEDFRVSAVGVLGQIHLQSPTTVVSVTSIAVGGVLQVRIQLPAAALAMGPAGSPAVPFETLVVAIDSFDELLESNELNNVRVLRRAEVPLAVSAVTTVVATDPPGVTSERPVATPPDMVVPNPATPSSPLDAIDPDKLGGDPQATN